MLTLLLLYLARRDSLRLHLPTVMALGAVGLLSAGCGRLSHNASDLDFALYPTNAALGGPMGRVLAKQEGFENDFVKIRICVHQTADSEVSDAQLRTEAQLAYSAWLRGAGLATNEVWKNFEFFSADCKRETGASGFVSLGLHDGEETASFEKVVMTCSATGSNRGCRATGITLGLGGPGSVSTWYRQSNPDVWTKLSHSRASVTWLSPFALWTSLENYLAQALSKDPGNAALKELKGLLEAGRESTKLEIAQLDRANEIIEDLRLTDGKDTVFSTLSQDFFRSSRPSLEQEYRPRYSVFHVLLHEVGHQFGMSHADNPGESTVTGPSISTRQNESGQFVTDESTMAYADPYFYLTADDRAGIKAMRNSLTELLQKHKPRL